MTIRNDMLSEITSRLIFHLDQCLFEHRPAENINSHGRKIAPRIRRLLLKLGDSLVFIGNYDSETTCFFDRNRHCRDRHICMILLVKIQHDLVIHLVNMIS